jgi:large subunit ribosomal protein L10
MPTPKKEAAVAELTEVMKSAKGIYFADFTGLDVPTFTQLRKQLREESVAFRVIKNRLAKMAAKEAGLEGLGDMLSGPTGLVTSEEDPVSPARILSQFADKTEGRPKMKAGYVEGRIILDEQLEALAKLPPREILLGQMVSAMQGPISGLVFTLSAILQSLVGTLHALAEKRRAEEGQ